MSLFWNVWIDALVIGSLDEDRPAAQETKKRSGKS